MRLRSTWTILSTFEARAKAQANHRRVTAYRGLPSSPVSPRLTSSQNVISGVRRSPSNIGVPQFPLRYKVHVSISISLLYPVQTG